jgi:hypothetical protein
MTSGHFYKYKFEIFPGFFINYQDVASQSPNKHMTTPPYFGLKPLSNSEPEPEEPQAKKYDWPGFLESVRIMNESAAEGMSYKILFLTRHARGVHNVAEAKYGTEAWDVGTQSKPLLRF